MPPDDQLQWSRRLTRITPWEIRVRFNLAPFETRDRHPSILDHSARSRPLLDILPLFCRCESALFLITFVITSLGISAPMPTASLYELQNHADNAQNALDIVDYELGVVRRDRDIASVSSLIRAHFGWGMIRRTETPCYNPAASRES